MTLYLTALFAGLLILIQIGLTVIVGTYRGKVGIQLLHGDDDVLMKRIRAHGNFTETVPITLIGMAVAELAGAPVLLLLVGGAGLVLGRLIHATNFIGSAGGLGAGRATGMAFTTLSMAAFGVYGLLIFGGAV